MWGERGIGATADIVFFALTVSMACVILVGSTPSSAEGVTSGYARRYAQNTLLMFQEVPTGKLGNFSYTLIGFRFWKSPDRELDRKTVTQLIAEDVLLNPEWKMENKIVSLEVNDEFGDELGRFLESSLNRILGGRFGHKLTVRLNPVRFSDGRVLRYERIIEDRNDDSERLCSETLRLSVSIPGVWREGIPRSDEGRYSGSRGSEDLSMVDFRPDRTESPDGSGEGIPKLGTLILRLELWSD